MQIKSMLHGHLAIADEDGLIEIRKACLDMAKVADIHSCFKPLFVQLWSQIDIIDSYIDSLHREDKYAEENAKYKEDRPNA